MIMENTRKVESGYNIKNLILLESNFRRESNVIFNDPQIIQDISVELDVQVSENTSVFVNEHIIYKQIFQEKIQVEASIKMVGVFEKIGDSQLDLEQFGNVNGPAIIFPYIREHITNLSAKAGLGLILIPPINFSGKKKQ